jgi:hypothetical protein
MSPPSSTRKRPAIHISLPRASRLLRLVRYVAESARAREAILSTLGIGLRTFYREIELLNRCGVKIRNKGKLYVLQSTAEQAEGRLPFPDPQLSFAEMAELAQCPGEAGRRLASLLSTVVDYPIPPPKRSRRTPRTPAQRKTGSKARK